MYLLESEALIIIRTVNFSNMVASSPYRQFLGYHVLCLEQVFVSRNRLMIIHLLSMSGRTYQVQKQEFRSGFSRLNKSLLSILRSPS